MVYEYTKFEETSDPEDVYIRLFHLSSGPSTGHITGELKPVLLSQAPSFEALSYCWGRPTDTDTIYIVDSCDHGDDGTPTEEPLVVPGSLVPFLRRSRPKNGARAFWIDAICINQKDNKEKSSQVPRMRDIYAKAKFTVSWLGPEADSSTEALTYLESLDKLFRRKLSESNLHKLTEDETKQGIASFEFKIKIGDPKLEATFQLLNRPYFERAWIVQEVVVSNNVWFNAGNSLVHWHVIVSAFSHLLHFEPWVFEFYPSHRLLFVMAIRYGEMDWESGKDIEWWKVLLRQRVSLSSDPRDKIYAYYGLRCKKDFQRMDIKPDYENTSTEQLYIQLASKALGNLHQAEVLSIPRLVLGQEQNERDDWESLRLPSWAPDWRWTEETPSSLLGAETGTEAQASFREDFNATKGTTFEAGLYTPERSLDEGYDVSSHGLPTMLRVRAYTVAIVTKLSPSWTLQKPTGRQTYLEQARVLQENQIQLVHWEKLFLPSGTSLMYAPTNQPFITAAIETLTVGRSTFTQEQKLAAWQSFESRQRFLRILPKFGLHHFLVPYVCIVLIERVIRYLGFPNPEILFRAMATWMVNRKCAQAVGTSDVDPVCEYLGLVPGLCKLGDHVVLVKGGPLPLVLRPMGEYSFRTGETVKTWELVGDAYVHGIVRGERWDEDKCGDFWIA